MSPSNSMTNSIDETFADAEPSSQSDCTSSSKWSVQNFLGLHILQQRTFMQLSLKIRRFWRKAGAVGMLAVFGMRTPLQVAGTIIQLISVKVVALMLRSGRGSDKRHSNQFVDKKMFSDRSVAKNHNVVMTLANSWLNDRSNLGSLFRCEALDATY